jgi:hypothetical protein
VRTWYATLPERLVEALGELDGAGGTLAQHGEDADPHRVRERLHVARIVDLDLHVVGHGRPH